MYASKQDGRVVFRLKCNAAAAADNVVDVLLDVLKLGEAAGLALEMVDDAGEVRVLKSARHAGLGQW